MFSTFVDSLITPPAVTLQVVPPLGDSKTTSSCALRVDLKLQSLWILCDRQGCTGKECCVLVKLIHFLNVLHPPLLEKPILKSLFPYIIHFIFPRLTSFYHVSEVPTYRQPHILDMSLCWFLVLLAIKTCLCKQTSLGLCSKHSAVWSWGMPLAGLQFLPQRIVQCSPPHMQESSSCLQKIPFLLLKRKPKPLCAF